MPVREDAPLCSDCAAAEHASPSRLARARAHTSSQGMRPAEYKAGPYRLKGVPYIPQRQSVVAACHQAQLPASAAAWSRLPKAGCLAAGRRVQAYKRSAPTAITLR